MPVSATDTINGLAHPRRDGDLAVFGELAGIGKQVGDNLLRLSSVAVHIAHAVIVDISRRRLHFVEAVATGILHLRRRPAGLNLAADLHLASLDLRQVEDVINERGSCLRKMIVAGHDEIARDQFARISQLVWSISE